MGPPSNRTSIIEAAMRVAETRGITAITIDAVAAEAALTKGGLLYHFPHRNALLIGIHTHLAAEWEQEMIRVLGKQPEEASDEEKTAAYVRVASRSLTRAELLYIADAGPDPELFAPWAQIAERWAPALPTRKPDGFFSPEALRTLIVRLAADGLWGYDTITGVGLPTPVREAIVHEILDLLPSTSSRG